LSIISLKSGAIAPDSRVSRSVGRLSIDSEQRVMLETDVEGKMIIDNGGHVAQYKVSLSSPLPSLPLSSRLSDSNE
jgi:hypothetical protein